ncbi:MAG: nucleotidyltransferase family protein [Blastocatellia bacterium]
MNKIQILSLLNQHWQEIQSRFTVKRLTLFGSAARDEMREDSDIDVLVEFDGPATFDGYMDLKFFLENILNRPVDLVTQKGLRKEVRPFVEKEAIHVT